MKSFSSHISEQNVFIVLAVFVTLLLFIVSMDSYTQDLIRKCDSTYFYMCGKAWMNGLIPYVDFSDSKGPLLWLIYGIGYLLSPHSMVGVYWMSCLWYTATLYILYKTACVFLDARYGMIVAALMMVSFFFPVVHKEVRAEDYSQLFIALSMYVATQVFYAATEVRRVFFLLGVSFAGTLLIKYNIAVVIGFISLVVFIEIIKEKHSWTNAILYFIFGFVAITFPFAAYFLSTGTFIDFVTEYFYKTFLMSRNVPSVYFSAKVVDVFTSYKLLMLIPSIASVIAFALSTHRKRWLYPVVFLFAFCICSMGNNMSIYYYQVLSWFWFPGLVALFQALGTRRWLLMVHDHTTASITVIGLAVIILSFLSSFRRESFFLDDNACRQNYHRVAYMMSRLNHPRVLYYKTPNTGYDIPAEGLPVCKYWAMQIGAGPEVYANQDRSLNNRLADFVIIDRNNKEAAKRLITLGYYDCSALNMGDYQAVYSKEEPVLPPSDYHYSNWDVLVKK